MAATLPQYVLLQSKSNHGYLQFVHGDYQGYLKFKGLDAVSPYTKFQVQVSEADQTLVHLKSCYNNKYWVPLAEAKNFVLAAANEPEEDQTKLSCTLFRPMPEGDAVRFMHVNSKKYVAWSTLIGPVNSTLYLASEAPDQDSRDLFTVTDWSSLVIFPINIALKDSAQGKYLCVRPVKAVNYLQFVGDDLADSNVGQMVFYSGAGNISISPQLYGGMWTRSTENNFTDNFIIAATQGNDPTNQNALFSPTQIPDEENVFALKSLGNNKYCKSLDFITPFRDEIHGLCADDAEITTLSRLEVVDRAASRNVSLDGSDVRDTDVRVTAPTFLVLAAGEAINDSKSDVDVDVRLSYVAYSSTRTWSSTANGTLKVGVSTVSITSPVLTLVDGKIVTTWSEKLDIVWGVEHRWSEKKTEVVYNVRVPPMSKVTVQAIGRKTLFNVPFSYTQSIELYDGSVSLSRRDDGIYTGTETSLQMIKVEHEPIS